MFSKLLVPLDGSDTSMAAVPVAVAMARQFGAKLLLLEMVPVRGANIALATDVATGAMTDPGVIQTDVEVREQAAEGFVSAVAEQLTAQGLDVSFTTGVGDEDDGILQATAEQGVDLVVMASHRRGFLGRLFSGSVTDDVVHQSRVPVLVVPAPLAQDAATS